jgi:CheY-like chemotaxis protein
MPSILSAQEAIMNQVFSQQANSILPGKPIEILLVEDNPEDAALTMATLREGRIHNNVTRVEDGVQAIEFLHRVNGYAGAQRPDLILLDLRLPRMDGREVLAEIKNDPTL